MNAFLLLVLVVGALGFAGCVGGSAGKDCGVDAACIEAAAIVCEPAFGKVSLPGGNATMVLDIQVQSGTKDMCTYYFKMSDVVLSQGASTQDQAMAQMIEGKDMTCKKAAGPIFAPESFKKEQCTGQLADVLLTSIVEGHAK